MLLVLLPVLVVAIVDDGAVVAAVVAVVNADVALSFTKKSKSPLHPVAATGRGRA